MQLVCVQRVVAPVPGEPPTRPKRRLLGDWNIHVPQKPFTYAARICQGQGTFLLGRFVAQ